jgi:4a-hydroxytetrahydrobiopterin dehydratase
MPELSAQRCANLPAGSPALGPDQAAELLAQVPGWKVEGGWLLRQFDFKNFHQSMGFASAVAFIANAENHHPDLELAYKKCLVRWRTHSVQGLSLNDFIAAAKVDKLMGMLG